MEQADNHRAFKGNTKLGIKTGVQMPKPLKRSTENRLQNQFKQPILEGKETVSRNDNSFGNVRKASNNPLQGK